MKKRKAKSDLFPAKLLVTGNKDDSEFSGHKTIEEAVGDSDKLIRVAVYEFVREDIYTVAQVWKPRKATMVERYELSDEEEVST